MMQIVPVGSHARRAAAVARFAGPVAGLVHQASTRLAALSVWAISGSLGLLRRRHSS